MGCSSPKEDLEDEIMVITLKRVKIQKEREKQLKVLSDLEGYPINAENLAEYLAAPNKAKFCEIKKNNEMINRNNEQNNNKDEHNEMIDKNNRQNQENSQAYVEPQN